MVIGLAIKGNQSRTTDFAELDQCCQPSMDISCPQAYELRRCYPENGSKIDMAVQLLAGLPETGASVIALMDSWYTCQRLWNKAMEKGVAWKIEVMFKQHKMYLGLKSVMVRSAGDPSPRPFLLPVPSCLV